MGDLPGLPGILVKAIRSAFVRIRDPEVSVGAFLEASGYAEALSREGTGAITDRDQDVANCAAPRRVTAVNRKRGGQRLSENVARPYQAVPNGNNKEEIMVPLMGAYVFSMNT
jgi:hypothetical protein